MIVAWNKRAAYITQTRKLQDALMRSLDAAQVGEHVDLGVEELLQNQHLALDTYDRAVDAAAARG